MALAPVAYFSDPLEDYPNQFIKFYLQGTTTPLAMATDSGGGTTLAKAEISGGGTVPIGFIKTAGDAIFIPWVDGAYDLWIFPTAAEADANDTSNAIQIANDIDASGSGNITTLPNLILDSEQVTYLPPFAGSTSTNAEAKFSQIVDVKDFGAVGDGSTDDSTAINAAFAYANANSVPFVDITGVHAIANQIVRQSNVTVRCSGKIIINADIPVASFDSAITCNNKTRSKWIGGEVELTFASFDNSIFRVEDCDNCLIRMVDIIDGGLDRYPHAPIRSINNTRCRVDFIHIEEVQGIGVQSFNDDHSSFNFINSFNDTTADRTQIETNEGDHNSYIGNFSYCPGNTLTSAMSLNDQHSIFLGNRSVGGAFGLTVGDLAPDDANYSAVIGNVIDSPVTVGINVQATEYTALIGNVTVGGVTAAQGTKESNKCTYVGNVHDQFTSVGIRSGEHWTVVGNVADGNGNAFVAYRAHVDGDHATFAGNVGMNCQNSIYGWANAGQENATLVGNWAGDDQNTPNSAIGFATSNGNINAIGNSTDGNFTGSEQTGAFSALPFKDLSVTTEKQTAISDGTTGGAASAGAGNQFVEIEIDGITYKALHDGTV